MKFYGFPLEFGSIRVHPPLEDGRFVAATDDYGWIPGTYADGESALIAARCFDKFGVVPAPLQDPECSEY